jgi:hypothetical protein
MPNLGSKHFEGTEEPSEENVTTRPVVEGDQPLAKLLAQISPTPRRPALLLRWNGLNLAKRRARSTDRQEGEVGQFWPTPFPPPL